MPRFEFQYPGEGDELLLWIQEKIQKIYMLNRTKKGHKFQILQDLEVRENDMLPTEFNAYCRDIEASVHFKLNPATGVISVSYYSESFGNKGGNPWWCIAESRPDSSVCGTGPTKITMLPADDEHAMSIKEYLDAHIKREIPDAPAAPALVGVAPACGPMGCLPTAGGSRKKNRKASRKNRKNSKASRKNKNRKASRKH